MTALGMRLPDVCGSAIAVALLAPAPAAAATPGGCHRLVERMQSLITDLKTGGDAHQLGVGPALGHLASNAPGRCRRAMVPPLLGALQDPSDLRRAFVASAIGDLGAAAWRAIPALKRAVKLDKCVCSGSDCFKGSWSSTAEVRSAIIKITGDEGDRAIYQCAYSGSVPMHPN